MDDVVCEDVLVWCCGTVEFFLSFSFWFSQLHCFRCWFGNYQHLLMGFDVWAGRWRTSVLAALSGFVQPRRERWSELNYLGLALSEWHAKKGFLFCLGCLRKEWKCNCFELMMVLIVQRCGGAGALLWWSGWLDYNQSNVKNLWLDPFKLPGLTWRSLPGDGWMMSCGCSKWV